MAERAPHHHHLLPPHQPSTHDHASFEGVRWSIREVPPSHYMLHIESFSSLTLMLSDGGGTQFFKSQVFHACGHKWTFSVYPNGDVYRGSKGNISVFLSIEDTDALPLGWEVYADLKFILFDQRRDKYLVFQDNKVNRFHVWRKEWGIPNLVSRRAFEDAGNGFLVGDECVFGVEVFVLKSVFGGEHLSPSLRLDKTFTWRLSDFDLSSSQQVRRSHAFLAGSFQWVVELSAEEEYLALHLKLVDSKDTSARLLVNFMMSIRNQLSGKDKTAKDCGWVTAKSARGWSKFIPLIDLQDPCKGFLVDNCIVVEAHIKNVSIVHS
ncbi:unnamed protein product [Cuscuta campestris]|uniref:MATH domain-containing protein n=1 Tax=Cuscuta campestris TaxID=132261 RepID=A0A484L2J3_9ASTE|nr:unnamed protein product [Cuscuta campestris]